VLHAAAAREFASATIGRDPTLEVACIEEYNIAARAVA
jgi:hypothetical protein